MSPIKISNRPTEADTCRDYVVPRLNAAGWEGRIREQHYFTHGRIIPAGQRHFRKRGKRADYLLMFRQDFPLAVVEAKKSYKLPAAGLQQAMDYAEILDLKFAYSTNGKGIVEHDFITGKQRELDAFPAPDELWQRFKGTLGLSQAKDQEDLLSPFNRELYNPDGSRKQARYYQRVAIDRTVQAVLQGRKRLLLTMATGTGKTFVAVQVAWKLWKTGRKKRILYLADRNILVQQPLTREFSIFGDAVHRIQGGVAKKGREIYFALYQSIAEDPNRPGLYKEYPRDYFDLIIVDECHRGSARDESNWRTILEYFAPAAQIGMTATPKRRDNVDTYQYFGNPIYSYSLARGIEDGFLAPFRVHRVVPSVDATGWRPTAGELDRFGRLIPDGMYTTADFERLVSILARTEAVAKHLTEFLKRTDRFGKTIVFCVDQEHAEQMRAALHKANEDLTWDHAHYVARVVSDEGEVGRKHLDDFQDPDQSIPVIVTTSQLLTTGVDVPDCKNIVLFKAIGSIVEFKQIIGRGTRICEERDKHWFNILDYTGATRLFADPDFDGEPEYLSEEEIDEKGDPVGSARETNTQRERADDDYDDTTCSGLDGGEGERRKFYVDGIPVEIAAQAVFELDASGRTIRTVRYTDFTAEQVRTLYRSPSKLREGWTDGVQRERILAALHDRGITVEQLVEATGASDADPLDLLIHVAWRGPLRSRRERTERVQREESAFFNQLNEKARAVLNDILDKYTDHGINQLDDLHVLEIPPISKHGTVVEIADAFGGTDRLKAAVNQLQKLLYAA